MAEEFTVRLNVEESTEETYREFIENLRLQLGNGSPSHNIPVLCPESPEETPPSRFFDVVLVTGSNTVRFRFRLDNLYLIGYQNGDNQWMEFRNGWGRHLILNSNFLPYTGDYGDLTGRSNANRLIEDTPVGYMTFVNAVDSLAHANNEPARARSLITVIMMISEAVRSTRVSDFVIENYFTPDAAIGVDLVRIIRCWGNLSERLIRAEQDPDYTFQMPEENQTGITTLGEAIAAVGILKFFLFQRRHPRDVSDADSLQDSVQNGFGQMLAEVFSVRLDNIDGESPGDLYGTITVTDGLSSQSLYDRNSNDYESIKPGEICTLTGPSRCISAYDSFTIDLNLKDYDTISWDDEVSCGQMRWNVYDFTNKYNVFLSQTIDGKYGSSTVNYAVFRNAVQAILEVTLINGDGENQAQVYGLLAAQDNLLRQEIRLFRISEPKQCINVRPGERIPLARSAVVVSLTSSLNVRAELYDYDTLSPDDEISKGSAQFFPELSGTKTLNITGKYGEIEVKVTWINN